MSSMMEANALLTTRDKPAPRSADLLSMIIMMRRVESAIRDMINALFRSGRSGVLNTAMDFSCSFTDKYFRTVSTAIGMPIHLGAIDLIPRAVVAKFGDDIHPGDCFVNNSAYMGNTHCGDFTLCSPIFVGKELVGYSIARAHFSDMGFPQPTTYHPLARDCYEEGLMLPCVRIQRNFVDVPEVIDICKANIRVPDQFYGDYLATVAAARTGERRIGEICDKYGVAGFFDFMEKYQAYGDQIARRIIGALPAGRVTKEMRYDSQLEQYKDGIPIRATIEVDPVNERITIDLTDNIDNVPLGINLTEATVRASCLSATFAVLGGQLPRCTGAFDRITIKMREGCAIGIPKFPAATSTATTNLAHALMSHIQAIFADIGDGLGTGYATAGTPASCGCLSGHDSRYGRHFVNQLVMGYWGGPALHGHDGWVTFGSCGSQGSLWQSSVELGERQQPIVIEKLEVRTDSGGAGQWEGAPGAECIIRTLSDEVRVMTKSASRDFPPMGTAGGLSGGGIWTWRRKATGELELLPGSFDASVEPGEALVSHSCGGGGYGSPLERDPERVRKGVRDGWISERRAAEIYGVKLDRVGDDYVVDLEKTAEHRRQMAAA